MPPLMGAGAFVMVELTGVPYTGIMAAALLPALLYFCRGLDRHQCLRRRSSSQALPRRGQAVAARVLITSGFFLVPFAVLLWGMFGCRADAAIRGLPGDHRRRR